MNKNKLKQQNLNQNNRVEPVEVYCRIRPLPVITYNEKDRQVKDDLNDLNKNACCLKILDEYNLILQIPECSNLFKSGQIKQLVYSFHKIFNEASTQKDLFEDIGMPLVRDLLCGKNGLLFTYGVTGSGKTYTMLGNQQSSGMLQRSLDTLFNSISYQQAKKYTFKPDKLNSFELLSDVEAAIERQQKREGISNTASSSSSSSAANMKRLNEEASGKLVNVSEDHIYAVFISCIEIYNNYIYDLLDADLLHPKIQSSCNNKESKLLKEDSKGSMFIKDVSEIEVKSTEEALELMHKAQKRRVVAYTDLNAESSRSHSIFTIRVVQMQQDPIEINSINNNKRNSTGIHVSQLSLVDLAGSERIKRTKNTGSRLREAGSINSSLMALRNCMEVLKENIANSNSNGLANKKMVPYRDSKLTMLFKNYFEGYGKIKMILCINPSAVEFDETINVLKFSDLVKDILVPSSNSETNFNNNPNLKGNQLQIEKMSMEVFEQANLALLTSLQQNNYSIMSTTFPPMDIFSPDDDRTIRDLINYLEDFQRKREAILQETDLLKQQFYLKLRDFNEQIDKIKQDRNEYKTRLEQKEREQIKSESKIKALEKLINTNSNGNLNSNYLSSNYQRTPLSSCNNRHAQFTTPSTNSRLECATITATGGKAIPMLMHSGNNPTEMTPIIGTSSSNCENFKSNQIISSSAVTTTQSVSSRRIAINSNNQVPPLPPSTPSTSTFRNKYTTPTPMKTIQQLQEKLQLQSTGSMQQGVPVANRRAMVPSSHSRRSKSAEMWLDHKPTNTPKLDTIMQPKMERKISVSKLELSDAKKSSKYLLTHQQQDDYGEIVTNLIKGNICQSPSGGANCVFTDIEVLQCKVQEPAKPVRKRPSEENVIEDKITVQDRCSIAIEGHSSSSSCKSAKILK